MAKNDTRLCFESASRKLGLILAEHKEAKAKGECGRMLAAMAESIRQRAESDPTTRRGETFDDLTTAS